MTEDQIISVLTLYKNLLAMHGYSPERQLLSGMPSLWGALKHAAWMVDELLDSIKAKRWDKVNRWFGFIQGVLWCEGFRDIDTMRRDNMPPDAEYKSRDS